MKNLSQAKAMQKLALEWRQQGQNVALVPTMGFLHQGHASLIEKARKLVGPQGKVVVSIFVNPTQFGPHEDFERYPRSESADRSLCRELGADCVFVPPVKEIYPEGQRDAFSTFVLEERLSQTMEGASRPEHFRGVTTIVTILFNLILPTHAVFGEKDFQQAAIIKKMVHDLRQPVKVVIGKTIREADGLALSSRNAYLSTKQRKHAHVLIRAIKQARAQVRSVSQPTNAKTLEKEIAKLVSATPGADLDYVTFFDPVSLSPVTRVTRQHRIALAVRFGQTRLIDNGKL